MSTLHRHKAKEQIMAAAWKLFQTQGYEETTISQIIAESGTSRSTFYHHFHGKDELLFTIAYTYDADYDLWLEQCDPSLPAVDQLISFNCFVMKNLEESPYHDLYPALYGLQVTTDGVRHILNPKRRYYQILREILKRGIKNGEIISSRSYAELCEMITNMQIGLTYAWCLQQRRHSLLQYGETLITPFLESLRADSAKDAQPTDA